MLIYDTIVFFNLITEIFSFCTKNIDEKYILDFPSIVSIGKQQILLQKSIEFQFPNGFEHFRLKTHDPSNCITGWKTVISNRSNNNGIQKQT